MAKGFTLAQLQEEVRWHADLEEADLRLTPEALKRSINRAIDKYRSMVCRASIPVYMREYAVKMPRGASLGPDSKRLNWSEIDLSAMPTQFEDIIGIDIRVNDITYELQSTSFGDRNKYVLASNYPGVPEQWFMKNETTMCLSPPSDYPYNITIWYLPEHEDLSSDEDIFDPIIKKGEEWIVWEVIKDIAIRDNYPQLEASASNRQAQCENDIVTSMAKRMRDRPHYRKNTRLRRAKRKWLRFFPGRTNSPA